MSTLSAPKQIPPLDGVRGLAAFMVLVVHFWERGGFEALPVPSWLVRFASIGGTGVDLFFVLSGFLITRILLASRSKEGYFVNFYARRSLRILPLYYGFLIIYYFLIPFIDGRKPGNLEYSWWYWCYLQNIPLTFNSFPSYGPMQYWSLAVEEHFYLFWPLLLYIIPSRHFSKACWSVVLIAFVCRCIFAMWLDVSTYYFTPCRMDALALGGLLACWELDGTLKSKEKQILYAFPVVFTLSAVAWFASSGHGWRIMQCVKFLVSATLYAFLVAVVVNGARTWIVRACFNNPLGRFSGRVSYGTYVYHIACFNLARDLFPFNERPWMGMVAAFGSVYMLSWLSFRFLESPFLNLKKRFETNAPAIKLKLEPQSECVKHATGSDRF